MSSRFDDLPWRLAESFTLYTNMLSGFARCIGYIAAMRGKNAFQAHPANSVRSVVSRLPLGKITALWNGCFRQMPKNEVERDVTQRGQFDTDDARIEATLIRESHQNSLDARIKESVEPVRTRIAFAPPTPNELSHYRRFWNNGPDRPVGCVGHSSIHRLLASRGTIA